MILRWIHIDAYQVATHPSSTFTKIHAMNSVLQVFNFSYSFEDTFASVKSCLDCYVGCKQCTGALSN